MLKTTKHKGSKWTINPTIIYKYAKLKNQDPSDLGPCVIAPLAPLSADPADDAAEKEEAGEALYSDDFVGIWGGSDDAIDGRKEIGGECVTFIGSFLGFGLRVHMYLKKKKC